MTTTKIIINGTERRDVQFTILSPMRIHAGSGAIQKHLLFFMPSVYKT